MGAIVGGWEKGFGEFFPNSALKTFVYGAAVELQLAQVLPEGNPSICNDLETPHAKTDRKIFVLLIVCENFRFEYSECIY